jgi:hypothetical protein
MSDHADYNVARQPRQIQLVALYKSVDHRPNTRRLSPSGKDSSKKPFQLRGTVAAWSERPATAPEREQRDGALTPLDGRPR